MLISKMAGWLIFETLTLKSLPVNPVVDIGQVYDPCPPLPIDVLALIVPTGTPAFQREIFTVDPGLPV